MSAYQDLTEPASNRLSPSRQKAQAKTSAAISSREAAYLYHLRETNGDDLAALTLAGYAPQDAQSAKAMAFQLRQRINEQCDARSIFTAAGMGLIEWTLALNALMHEDPKWQAVGLKMWGVVLGAFGEVQTGQGAQISVQVLQTQGAAPTHTGMVRVEVDARKPLAP